MTTSSTSAAPASSNGASEVSQPDGNSADESIDQQPERGAAPSNSPRNPGVSAKNDADEDPEWDFGNGKRAKRSEVTKRLRDQAAGAQKAWSERQEFEKQAKQYEAHLKDQGVDVELWKKDPKAAFRKAAAEELARQLDESTRDPRELAAEKANRERDEAHEKLRQHEEQQKQEQHKRQVSENFDALAGHVAKALQEHGLPPKPKSVWLMASLLQAARRRGERVSLSDLARQTDEQLQGTMDHYLPEPDKDPTPEDGASIAKRLGTKRVEALRLHLLREHESKFAPKPTQQRPSAPREIAAKRSPSNPNGYITVSEMLEAQRKR